MILVLASVAAALVLAWLIYRAEDIYDGDQTLTRFQKGRE